MEQNQAGSNGAASSLRRDGCALLLGRNLLPNPLLLLPQLGSKVGAEVFGLEYLANLDLALLEGGPLQPLDRLFLRSHLPQPEPGDQLLGLGKRSIDDSSLAALEATPGSLRAGLQPFACQHNAGLGQLLIELAHLGQNLLIRKNPGFGFRGRLHDYHKPHVRISSLIRRVRLSVLLPSSTRRMSLAGI